MRYRAAGLLALRAARSSAFCFMVRPSSCSYSHRCVIGSGCIAGLPLGCSAPGGGRCRHAMPAPRPATSGGITVPRARWPLFPASARRRGFSRAPLQAPRAQRAQRMDEAHRPPQPGHRAASFELSDECHRPSVRSDPGSHLTSRPCSTPGALSHPSPIPLDTAKVVRIWASNRGQVPIGRTRVPCDRAGLWWRASAGSGGARERVSPRDG